MLRRQTLCEQARNQAAWTFAQSLHSRAQAQMKLERTKERYRLQEVNFEDEFRSNAMRVEANAQKRARDSSQTSHHPTGFRVRR